MRSPQFFRAIWATTLGVLFSGAAQATLFQAEEYDNFFDTTAGNTGGAFRSDDVDIEATTDTDGGYNVGWIEATEWLAYNNLSIPSSGSYTVNMRVASPNGATASVDLDGGSTVLGTADIPATGGWQTWTTLSFTTHIDAGTYSLGVFAETAGWNFNWIEVVANDTGGGNDGGTGDPAATVTQEAEDYVNFFDTTAGNTGGAHRNDDVDIEATTDTGGGFNVGWIDAGEWLEYTVTLNEGTYTVESRVASDIGNGAFTVDLNGNEIVGTQNVANTGGWQSWTTLSSNPVTLPGGTHTVRVNMQNGGFNLNWIRFNADGDSGGSDPDPGTGNLVWSDEFDSINTDNWTFEVGGNGWGNQELQYYTNGDNAFIEFDPEVNSNVLVIEAREQGASNFQCWYGPCEYTSTRMISLGKQEFTFGRMEARIKLPQTQGIWPAFWMMGNDFQQVGWPNNGELDIMEHVGFEPFTTHGAVHGPGYSGNTPFMGTHVMSEQVDQNYHIFAVEWEADQIRWFVDDVNFFTLTRSEVEDFGPWVFDHPFFFLFNVAVGGTWPGSPDASSSFPQRMYIDYVRVYQ